ncbi:hypothetical protein F383_24697 [Gossypium arboreum]|uniref:Uncharacterized protein n=1 Tax=Gossypium arboreum TaxID=29729 RepID=A0A0B0MRJ6_GOSAR|nr:hypothetical protein F383_24697 [Gossypium arboreum]
MESVKFLLGSQQ